MASKFLAPAALCALALDGCAITSSVNEVNKGVFTISSLGSLGQPGSDLLDELYEKGHKYCGEKKLQFKLLSQQTNNGTYTGTSRPFSAPSTSGGGFWGGFNQGISNMVIPTGTYGRARIYFTCVNPEAEAGAADSSEPKFRKIFSSPHHTTYYIPGLTQKGVNQLDGSTLYQIAVAKDYAEKQSSGALSSIMSYGLYCSNGLMLPLEKRLYEEHFPSNKQFSSEKFSAAHQPAPSLLENALKNQEYTSIYQELCR